MKEALEHLLSNEVAASNALNAQTKGLPLLATPKNFDLKSIEHLQETRQRFRGLFSTASIDDFLNYSTNQELDNTSIFIDADNLKAEAIFDLGDTELPLHCDHRATYQPRKTAAYMAIHRIRNERLSQKDLTDFIEDWLDEAIPVVVLPNGNHEPLRASQAINSIRTIKIEERSSQTHTEGNFSASRSAMDEIEASSNVDVLPDFLVFNIVPYEGFLSRPIHLKVNLLTGGDKPYFGLRWVGEEAQKEAISNELVETLQQGLPDGLKVYRGEFN